MLKRILAAMLALALSFSLAAFAQDATKQEMKKVDKKMEMAKDKMDMSKDKMEKEKMEMTEAEKAMGALKSMSCDEACGFMIRSRDEKEIESVMKAHAKKVHKMAMTEKQMKEMLKIVDETKK